MYFDPARNAYVDKETGEVIFQETDGTEATQNSDGFDGITDAETQSQLRAAFEVGEVDVGAFKTNSNKIVTKGNYTAAGNDDDNEVDIEQQRALFNMYSNTDDQGNARSDDWYFARTLQMLEFEIGNEQMEGGDFNEKEYRASRSCTRQLLTVSFLICLIQIAFMVAMIQIAGYAPKSENPLIGPPVYIMVRFGAKEAGLIVVRNEWWRCVSTMMLHAGIFHILPNVAIQLRVGGYLNLVYGTPKWLFIYLISGIFGCMMSCIFIPDSVGVGSSGALMGMLSSWIVWIIFRWKKIPRECKRQRNCQLFIVFASVVITLATSFTPNVDWAAHAGGTIQGILWGIVLLSNELDNNQNRLVGRLVAGAVAIALLIYSLYYMIVKLHPSTANFAYWDANDDWGR